MPSTWKMWSKEVFGYEARLSYTNEKYVAVTKITEWLNQGYTAYECALKWNGGSAIEKSGINKHGIAYNTRTYANKVIKNIR